MVAPLRLPGTLPDTTRLADRRRNFRRSTETREEIHMAPAGHFRTYPRGHGPPTAGTQRGNPLLESRHPDTPAQAIPAPTPPRGKQLERSGRTTRQQRGDSLTPRQTKAGPMRIRDHDPQAHLTAPYRESEDFAHDLCDRARDAMIHKESAGQRPDPRARMRIARYRVRYTGARCRPLANTGTPGHNRHRKPDQKRTNSLARCPPLTRYVPRPRRQPLMHRCPRGISRCLP